MIYTLFITWFEENYVILQAHFQERKQYDMKLFDVYPLFDVNIVKGEGCKVWDDKGNEYLDLYGGHAVISIGHCHPHYVEKVSEQLNN